MQDETQNENKDYKEHSFEDVPESGVEDGESPREETAEEAFVPDDPAKVEQAERVLREANLARVRGTATVADRLLKEAVELAPNTATVLEAVGDDLVARGQFRKAKEAYSRAHKIDPKNVSVENKYGEMVLKVDLHIDPFAHAHEFEGYASAKNATYLSLLCPGLGQFAVERYVKGWTMLGAFAFVWVLNVFIPSGMPAFTAYLAKKGPFEPLGPILIGVSVVITLWSVFDLTSLKTKAPKKFDPPVPPSEWMNR